MPSVLGLAMVIGAQSGGLTHLHKHGQWHYDDRATVACGSAGKPQCGPSLWNTIPGDAKCGNVGDQSPIDAKFASAKTSTTYSAGDLVMTSPKVPCSKADFLINEHTTELAFESPDTCKHQAYVTFKGERFNLVQFHYHSPSENIVDGGYYPMEVHHVHVKEGGTQALVISVMVKIGTPAGLDVARAQFLTNIFHLMPHIPAHSADNFWKQEQHAPSTGLDAYTSFIPSLTDEFFYYSGSFTTPPCTTDTHWIMAGSPVTITQATLDMYRKQINSDPDSQLARFEHIVGPSHLGNWHPSSGVTTAGWNTSLGCNNRPIQALTGKNGPFRRLHHVQKTIMGSVSFSRNACGSEFFALVLAMSALASF